MEGLFFVTVCIAVCHEIHEIEEVFQRNICLLGRDGFAAVSRVVANHADEIDSAKNVIAHHILEFHGVNERHKVILIGHNQAIVHRIHPLDGKFRCSADIEDAGGQINPIQLLRSHRSVGKG